MYVRDATGKDWRVDGKRRVGTDPDGYWRFRMTGRDRMVVEVPAHLDHPIFVLIPSNVDEAETIIARLLPVSGVRRRVVRVEDLRTHPDTEGTRRMVAAHLAHMHNVSIRPAIAADSADLEGLIELHAACHAEPAGMALTHVHVPYSQL